MIKLMGVFLLMMTTTHALGGSKSLPNFSFNSIDGGKINLNEFNTSVFQLEKLQQFFYDSVTNLSEFSEL